MFPSQPPQASGVSYVQCPHFNGFYERVLQDGETALNRELTILKMKSLRDQKLVTIMHADKGIDNVLSKMCKKNWFILRGKPDWYRKGKEFDMELSREAAEKRGLKTPATLNVAHKEQSSAPALPEAVNERVLRESEKPLDRDLKILGMKFQRDEKLLKAMQGDDQMKNPRLSKRCIELWFFLKGKPDWYKEEIDFDLELSWEAAKERGLNELSASPSYVQRADPSVR